MTGRNDPCPCGSGKKYKRCCMRSKRLGDYTQEDREEAHVKLFEYGELPKFASHRRTCELLFWGSEEFAVEVRTEFEDPLRLEEIFRFLLWSNLDADVDRDTTVLDRLMFDRGDRLSVGARAYLERVRPSHLALYEVEEVWPGVAMRLREVWGGRSVRVSERSASTQLVRWDLLATRVFEASSGEHQIEGDTLVFDREDKSGILEVLEAEFEKYHASTGGTRNAFLKRCGFLLHQLWLDLVLFRPDPELTTPEGTPLEIGTSVIDVRDRQLLAECLDAHPAFAADQGAWVCEENDVVLATLSLDGSRLVVEGLSRERLRRARELVREAAAQAGLKHRSTHYQDPLDAAEGAAPEAVTEMPEIERAVVLEFKNQHYRGWIDDEIPALGGLTPREAARDLAMRPRLVDLLKDIEIGETRAEQIGQPAVDIGWMWDELGLRP